MHISYKPKFLRSFKKLSKELQDETHEKIKLFKDTNNHKRLKVHTLSGKLKGFNSFSINFKYRIVFKKEKKDGVVFLLIGTHDIYK